MATRKSNPTPEENLPISKQTAGGVAGAVVGSAVAGPLGAVVGAVAGTMMGNRAAKGKSLVSTQTVQSVKGAAAALRAKVHSVIPKLPGNLLKRGRFKRTRQRKRSRIKSPIGPPDFAEFRSVPEFREIFNQSRFGSSLDIQEESGNTLSGPISPIAI